MKNDDDSDDTATKMVERDGERKLLNIEKCIEFGKMGQSVVCNGLFVVCVKHLPFHNEVNLLM